MEIFVQHRLKWAYRLLACLLGIELFLAWQQLIDTGYWMIVVSSGFRLEGLSAYAWFGLRTLGLALVVMGWRPNILLVALVVEIVMGFLIASYDVSVYWRADCGCLPSSSEAYIRMALRVLELSLLIFLRR